MKPTPPGWPRMSASLCYPDAPAAIDWLCRAFDFEVRIKVEGDGGRIDHSELVYGEAIVMVGDLPSKAGKFPFMRAPSQVGGANTMNLFIYVDDVEGHCARARAAGAKIVVEPKVSDYGDEYWADRGYECEDPAGHHWWFAQRMRNPKS
jgi:uncharacterized glyoxalase superfamily protein PhnB